MSTFVYLLVVFILIYNNVVVFIAYDVDTNEYTRSDFPSDFVFGAGTSAYQVEGAVLEDGRTYSIWDTFAHSGVDTQLDPKLKTKIDWFVLNNSSEIDEYKNEFTNLMLPGTNLQTTFPGWFSDKIKCMRVNDESSVSDELFALANGPTSVNSYTACIVNGVRFVVESRDSRRTTQNSGVSTTDSKGTTYYGVLEDILELCYIKKCKVVLFSCKWYKTDKQGCVTKSNITSICTRYEWYKEEPYLLATQANQVFYLDDPDKRKGASGKYWKVVQEVHHRKIWERDINAGDIEMDLLHGSNSSDILLSANLDNVPYTGLSSGEPIIIEDAPAMENAMEDDLLDDDDDTDDGDTDDDDIDEHTDDDVDNECEPHVDISYDSD